MENSMEAAQEIKNNATMGPNIHFWAWTRRKQNHCIEEIAAPHVHCSTNHRSQDVEMA